MSSLPCCFGVCEVRWWANPCSKLLHKFYWEWKKVTGFLQRGWKEVKALRCRVPFFSKQRDLSHGNFAHKNAPYLSCCDVLSLFALPHYVLAVFTRSRLAMGFPWLSAFDASWLFQILFSLGPSPTICQPALFESFAATVSDPLGEVERQSNCTLWNSPEIKSIHQVFEK